MNHQDWVAPLFVFIASFLAASFFVAGSFIVEKIEIVALLFKGGAITCVVIAAACFLRIIYCLYRQSE